jgi:hypothetical protein
MRQYTEKYTKLESRQQVGVNEWTEWAIPWQEWFRSAQKLAHEGRITEAIEEAERTQLETKGCMDGKEFRCVTKTTTISTNNPLHDGWTST